ncbi:MAG TPA: DNA-3-methyladenine glycosylase 2 family protein [Candidatus Marinimicrobia bacterium]|jgi:3-methyladenine DNA glycosylase/8-oxoguanine DNA glycosylase|nr:DNA-3-methyladenine glycosylase 2 family protein [Candidatus Neomarinimicrobiota bacterium]
MNIDKGLKHLKKVDEKMGRLIVEFEKPEFKKDSNYFEALVRAIVYQQLSGKAAATIYKRFKNLFPQNKHFTPIMVKERSHEELRSAGLSNQKASYIHNIANAFYTGAVPKDIDTIGDNEVIECLTTIKGVGPWTAKMFLMFTLNRPDVFPVTDLGIQKGFQLFFQFDVLPSTKKMMEIAEAWRPYRTLASWYLWRLVEGPFEW